MSRFRRAQSTTIRENYDRIALRLNGELSFRRPAKLFIVVYKIVIEAEQFVRYAVSYTDPVLLEENIVTWSTDIHVNYYFERNQTYVLEVREYAEGISIEDFLRDGDRFEFSAHTIIGETDFKLSKLLTLPPTNSIRQLTLPVRIHEGVDPTIQGSLIVCGDIVAEPNDYVKWTFTLNNLPIRNTTFFIRNAKPFIAISKSNDNGEFAPVWNSNPPETPTDHYSLAAVRIAVSVLNNADMYKNIRFSVFDESWDRCIGEAERNLHDILENRHQILLQLRPVSSTAETHIINTENGCGTLKITNVVIEKEASFSSYLGSCPIALTVGIDFTSSNGDLHRIYPLVGGKRQFNPYEQAITQVGKILAQYDTDNRYPVYGFGAQLPASGKFGPASHLFPLHPNGVEVHGIEGILKVYQEFVGKVKFSGPTLFAPLITKVISDVRSNPCTQEHQKYHILLIITDDPNGDRETVLSKLIESSELPLSVIFIGVGNNDFTPFQEYLAKDGPDGQRVLPAYADHRAIRENVSFFRFNDLLRNGDLAEEILRKIPEQFLEYMAKNHITPNY